MPSIQIDGFKGDLVTPGDSDYNKLIQRFARNAVKPAAVVACVANETDVQLAIAYAKSEGLELAIKGGGHAASGASSTDGGLVIDLSRYINSIEVLPGAEAIRVGGGCQFRPVEKAAMEYGKMVVGGTVNDTGVGGLCLGGGYGFLTGEHGLALDNILAATIVTGNQAILHISGDDELFWGIRGGGCNLGVVTSLTLALHPQKRDVFSGNITFDLQSAQAVFDLARDWYASVPDPRSAFFIFLTSAGLSVAPFYNGTNDEGRRHFAILLELPCLSSAVLQNSLLDLTEWPWSPLHTYIKGARSAIPDSETVTRMIKHWEKLPDLCKDDDFCKSGSTIIFEYFPMEKKASVPPDATPYPERTLEPTTCILMHWNEDGNAEKNTVAKKFAKEAAAIMEGKDEVSGYGNYETEVDQTSKARLMFGSNYARLQKIKACHDPDGLFNRWFPISDT